MTPAGSLENPILNSPYEPPAEHFVLGPNGPTGEVKVGRRPSESYIPVPVGRRRRGAAQTEQAQQESLDFDVTGERREVNSLINDIRARVDRWRSFDYPGATPVSRKLLRHWADPTREDRVLFCQREAAETAIYLAEAAGRRAEPDFRVRIEAENRTHNEGLPRVGLKMATGTGKTIVMAMLIAWQTANKAFSPRDARFTNRFLVVTPGITIRDRLRVLLPADDGNYYRERDLVPPDLWPTLADASIYITNFHTLRLGDAKEIRGIAGNTRKLLTAGKKIDSFKETDAQMVERVLRDLAGRGKCEIVVLNDEAHHCYQDKPLDAGPLDAEAKERNEGARVWFRGLRAIVRKIGVKSIYDLSATPFYLGGSGYNEGYIFPWVASDFSLMDAIESGIVKVPRVPVDDDATGKLPTYLSLWEHIGADLPKRAGRKAASDADWTPPVELEGAMRSLYRSYDRRFKQWQDELAALGEPPPVFILVCPNTIVSKLVYDWIAGQEVERADGEVVLRPGQLDLLSNVVDGRWVERPRTILIDSAQLESGDAMKDDFKAAAGREIDVFKAEFRRRNPGADVDKLTDEDLLREVMNTVGKKGKLGEHAMRGLGVDAHRRMGHQHRHPHPRHPPLRQPAPVRTGGGPRPASAELRTQRRRPVRAGVRRGLRRALRLHPHRPPARSPAAGAARRGGPCSRRAPATADHLSQARRLSRGGARGADRLRSREGRHPPCRPRPAGHLDRDRRNHRRVRGAAAERPMSSVVR
ncbi:MAG TPA: DEAD/DEAH box helicase family protein [Acidimicrobiales bacterium]|nr:DEAD/DEAH box helicase family protein [Acidimicrobiales bacterium]